MSFLHPEFLYYMYPPLFILFALLLTQKETQAQFFSLEVMEKLRVSANTLTLQARNAIFLLMAFFMILALAQPVIKDGKILIKAKSADIMIALDISDSMLATDIYPNRLQSAKQKAITLLDMAPNERIGVIAFAQNSYLVSPLSFDTSAVSFLLKQLNTDSITEKGTDFLSVLNVFNETSKKDGKKYLLLLSDGGDKSDFSKEIEMAKKNDIVIFVLGIATKKGAPIKLDNGEFIKFNGSIIVSKLNENISNLATSTGGVYIQATNSSSDIKAMLREITNISEEKELKSEEIQKFIPLFYYPVAFALFLLLIATSSMGKRQSIKIPSLIILCSLALNSPNLHAGLLDFMDLKEAKEAYKKGEFEKSSNIYNNYANKSSNDEAYFNAANSLYKQKKYKEALEVYKKATFDTKKLRANNLSNIGNSYAKMSSQKNLQNAVKSYEKSLKILEDKQTRDNLNMVKKILEKQKQDSKKQDKKNKDKNQKNKDKKNKDKKNKDKKKNQDNKDGGKKESDENQKKSSDKKDKSKDEKNSSKSKKSKDKQKSEDDMKSEKEKNSDKDKSNKEKKQDLKKLKKDNKKELNKEKSQGFNKLSKDKMSEAEEKKWMQRLNMNKNTYMYKLNKEQKQYQTRDTKPW